MTARVTGIGGIFFKARDPEGLRAWYRDHLGIALTDWGGAVFEPTMASAAGRPSTLVWSIFRDPEGNRVELWEPPRALRP